jgi:hypothetical protein
MQTVTPGASRPEVTPIADGTRHFGGDWESVDEQAALASLVRERLTRHVEGSPTTARTRSPRSPRDLAEIDSIVAPRYPLAAPFWKV